MATRDEFTTMRDETVAYLRAAYLGPSDGDEEVIRDRPDRVYLVGTLYPQGQAARPLDGDSLGEDDFDEALDQPIELANAWQPASAAISFLHDAASITCDVSAARYIRLPEGGWKRQPMRDSAVTVEQYSGPIDVLGGLARLVSVWRPFGDTWLVTVSVQNTAQHDNAESPPPTEDCLFQVAMTCDIVGGQVLPYPSADLLNDDEEEQDLRLAYSGRRVFGVGHGCSVEWEGTPVTRVRTEMMPATVVKGVSPGARADRVLSLAYLSDQSIPTASLREDLSLFVATYAAWITKQARKVDRLPSEHAAAGRRVLTRLEATKSRLLEGVDTLCGDGSDGPKDANLLLAFRLANAAMRDQILQTRLVKSAPGRRTRPLPSRPGDATEPTWYPFQLAFQLLTVASTADASHADRNVVDLIWFPAGGGKTEAYLALAAFEMILRRLRHGVRGGGTAVLTRYTLRMLTAQQFQRASTLICALERMRKTPGNPLEGMPEFTIGLWVGGETTPNKFQQAQERTRALLRAQTPENPFQIDACPWCGTPLTPRHRLQDDSAYGFKATRTTFVIHCTHDACEFHDSLPVRVVDEQIFAEPPTLLIATVDKFARLPWVKGAGSLLGRGDVPFLAPGLVIQDELHLLSGPLGTTVALYEAAVLGLIAWDGVKPKIVASTATIRAASEQVRRLYGSPVSLFPPSGVDADDSFFATLDDESPGRLYIGLMPQAHTQSYSTVLALTALLEAPATLTNDPALLDAYWTVVAYHNSLRELGRTVTIARDDVGNLLTVRAGHSPDARRISRDGVIELTSNVKPGTLVRHLARLEQPFSSGEAVDVVASTNMLSVGIDISRLGLMLMNGQPKTTSEYIQATSRVGRSTVPGLVVTILRASKPRDRSHYETFRAYHDTLYRSVEPTSVTPWSPASRDRSLHAALVMLVRHGCGLRGNDDATHFRGSDRPVSKAVQILMNAVQRAEPDAERGAEQELNRLVAEWDRRAEEARAGGQPLKYESSDKDYPALLKDFGERKDGWETMHSMRSVDRAVRVVAQGESL